MLQLFRGFVENVEKSRCLYHPQRSRGRWWGEGKSERANKNVREEKSRAKVKGEGASG